MKHQDIISREYKLVLKTGGFAGDESSLLRRAGEFWGSLSRSEFIKCSGGLEKIDVNREIKFYDTADRTLFNHDYIFRERIEADDNKREITLKFRHADRYVAEDRDMLSKKIGKGEMKFEEDIKARFQVLYSYSSSQSCKENQEFKLLKDISKFYPGIENDIPRFADGEKIHVINATRIREKVIKGGEILLRDSPEVKAECALITWYDDDPTPLIVEFSFRYGNKKGKYGREISQNTYELFLNIQKEMSSWCDEENSTKTGFVFKKQ
jgi:hypothetical protein